VKREEVHGAWAPAGDPWSPWVKPVLFAHLPEEVTPRALPDSPARLTRELITPRLPPGFPVRRGTAGRAAHPYRGGHHSEAPIPLGDTALIIDLPAAAGVHLGLDCAALGFRPVPLYNALPSTNLRPAVRVEPIMAALADAAPALARLAPHGPPAFLRDTFDNRSRCSLTDFPSADRLREVGVRRVVLIREGPRPPDLDLEQVLAAWQRQGLELWTWRSDVADVAAAPWTLPRIGWLRRLFDPAVLLPSGNGDGTFGMRVTPHNG
jgi:hypothetical protein